MTDEPIRARVVCCAREHRFEAGEAECSYCGDRYLVRRVDD